MDRLTSSPHPTPGFHSSLTILKIAILRIGASRLYLLVAGTVGKIFQASGALSTIVAMATYIDEDYEKLESDLQTVAQNVQMCREMMTAGEDGLGEVVGFLEACLADRIPDLIKAGTQGQMSEDLFAKVLSCNDAVQRTLEAEREGKTIDVDDGLEGLIRDVAKTKIGNSGDNDLLGIGDSAMTGPAMKGSGMPVKKKLNPNTTAGRMNESFTISTPKINNNEDQNTYVSPFHTSSSDSNTPLDGNNQEDDFDKFLKEIDRK